MKKLLIAFSLLLAMSFTTKSAQAQITSGDVLAAAQGLVTVNVGAINVNAVDVIDVTNVLNGNDVRVLSNFLNGITIDNTLNNLLREADIIKDNQVVVGILNGVLLVAKQGQLRR